ncbi:MULTISPECIES: hypothetical protein [unclassified Moorena]|uniref:hypothetical protein n=1 Tax=unclassified Moorena TaxID=2683338 RepID=UPI0013CCCB07|nr:MULTISPECIES: hypothetical protein [unclassified Moorena]NEO21538.1 hypothetical protein [Moorena sp. SIO4A5]NEQ58826.1 hypothetical protein [Moorena sp. SIO4A1]
MKQTVFAHPTSYANNQPTFNLPKPWPKGHATRTTFNLPKPWPKGHATRTTFNPLNPSKINS